MSKRIPKLCRHQSGRGYSTDPFTKKEVYHGVYGTQACQLAYEGWLQRILARRGEVASGTPAGASVRVSRLLGDYLAFARDYYQKHGQPTSEYDLIKRITDEADSLYGTIQADAFGPSHLKAVRQRLIDRGNARRTVNRQTSRLVRAWRWGVEQEIVRPLTLVALKAVKHLARGRTKARETQDVPEVPIAVVERTLACLDAKTRAMVELHLWGCMRAEEVTALRGQDIDQSQEPWLFVPWSHKTEHHSRQRRIWLGSRCQAVLIPLLAKCRPSLWLFRAKGTERSLSTDGYAKRIATCCRKHNIPHWCPRNLRHTALTLVRKQFGLEGAQMAGGHAHARTTEIYTERDEALARKIAAAMG